MGQGVFIMNKNQNKNQDFNICSICGKDFRILRAPGSKSEIPELVNENGKLKWVCGDCREKIKKNKCR